MRGFTVCQRKSIDYEWTSAIVCIYTGGWPTKYGQNCVNSKVWRVFVAKKDKKKKDAQLVLRLPKDVRDRFIDACQELDTSAAREVRRFIKRFLKKYDKGELDE